MPYRSGRYSVAFLDGGDAFPARPRSLEYPQHRAAFGGSFQRGDLRTKRRAGDGLIVQVCGWLPRHFSYRDVQPTRLDRALEALDRVPEALTSTAAQLGRLGTGAACERHRQRGQKDNSCQSSTGR